MATRNPSASHASGHGPDLSTVLALVSLAIFAAMATGMKKLSNLVTAQRVRNDALGQGVFGAPRGSHTHQGLDLVVQPGQQVFSPIAGRFVRIAYPYAGDPDYTGVVLSGEGYEVKVFYIRPSAYLKPGTLVARGQTIGTAQDLRVKYGLGITPHIHVEVRKEVGGALLNPAQLLTLQA